MAAALNLPATILDFNFTPQKLHGVSTAIRYWKGAPASLGLY